MTEEDLVLQAANCPVMYLDGFGGYRKVNGLLRCVGFVFESGAQLNLVMSLSGADAACIDSRRALNALPSRMISTWSSGEVRAH